MDRNANATFRIFLMLSLALGAVPASVTAQAVVPEPATSCAGDGGKEPSLSLSWIEVPLPGSETLGTTVTLLAHNRSGETVDVVVDVLSDVGGDRKQLQRLSLGRLLPDAAASSIVDLAALRAPATMSYAGQLYAVARVIADGACDGGACDRMRPAREDGRDVDADGVADRDAGERLPIGQGVETLPGPSIYFHRSSVDPHLFEIYGVDILVNDHGGGDLSGRVVADPGDVILRVSDAGKGRAHGGKARKEIGILSVDAAADPTGGGTPNSNPPVPANAYRLCVKWEVGVTEQGRKVILTNGSTITEDYWHGHPTLTGTGVLAAKPYTGPASEFTVAARGVRVEVSKGLWKYAVNTEAATGCFTFLAPEAPPFQLTVYGEHHDAHGNMTIVKDADAKRVSWVTSVTPQLGKTRSVYVGAFSSEATMAAISGFAMYRSAMGNTGKTIDFRGVNTCVTKGGNNSSAHFNFSDLDDGIAYLRLSDGTGTSPDGDDCTKSDHRRAKFIMTHEMGHAWMLLRTLKSEPNVDLSESDPFEKMCSQGEGYTPDSLEAAAVGAREGMGHFYGAVVWNNTASSNAVFSMFGTGRDVETYTNEQGGQLWNRCTATIKCGRTVNVDWLRFWWDFHTPFKSGKPTLAKTAEIYEATIAAGELDAHNYYEKFREAMVPLVDAATETAWDKAAIWNGINTSPTSEACIAPYGYPDCAGDPELSGGEINCPCTDVLPTNANSPHLAGSDGHYPDGAGSYMENGSAGTAQYCLDDGNTEVVCNRVRNANSSLFAPVCQVCGVTTMFGCGCTNSEQCDGLDTVDLDCFGAPADGWQGSTPGTCLPSASTPQGREALIDLPWFCLDNCGSKAGGGNPASFACVYDQLPYELDHAQCIGVSGACSTDETYCESQGLTCDLDVTCNNDMDDCCAAECGSNSDCDGLGFPDTYTCNLGHCVPVACAGDQGSYCSLYR